MRAQGRKAPEPELDGVAAAYGNTGAPAGFPRLTRQPMESHPQEQDHADYSDA